jgi:hypothetical protein
MRTRFKEIFVIKNIIMAQSNLLKTIKNISRTEEGYVTYIIVDKLGFFKVGRSKDFKSRYRQIVTANPHVEHHYVINNDCENILHKILAECKYKNEWFTFYSDYKVIESHVLTFKTYTYFNLLLLLNLIKKHGAEKAEYIFAEIIFNRFKHFFCKC